MNIITKKEDENIREKTVRPNIWTQTSKGLIRRNNTNLVVPWKRLIILRKNKLTSKNLVRYWKLESEIISLTWTEVFILAKK